MSAISRLKFKQQKNYKLDIALQFNLQGASPCFHPQDDVFKKYRSMTETDKDICNRLSHHITNSIIRKISVKFANVTSLHYQTKSLYLR